MIIISFWIQTNYEHRTYQEKILSFFLLCSELYTFQISRFHHKNMEFIIMNPKMYEAYLCFTGFFMSPKIYGYNLVSSRQHNRIFYYLALHIILICIIYQLFIKL